MEDTGNNKSADYNNGCNRWLCDVAVAALTFFISLFSLFTPKVHGDIATDGSVGPARILSGPDFTIPQSLGTVSGNNLFHSFQTFSISESQSATFTGDHGIANVISRVTGGEISNIDGMLRSTVGDADFFFINPSGIIFGPHAQVDVPAAFHVSTAEELLFDDGFVLNVLSPETSTLTQARPESFGFTGAKPATIEINGTVLEFVPESEISLSSSDIIIQPYEDASPALVCQGGNIQLTTMGSSSGNVSDARSSKDALADKTALLTGAVNAGGVLVIDSARVNVSGNGGGNIAVQAGSARISNSLIASDNTGDEQARGSIDIAINQNLELSRGSRIQSNISGSGDSGPIRINAENMLIKQQEGENLTGVFIEVEPGAAGNGTAMDLSVRGNLLIEGGAALYSATYGHGDAAPVNVSANDVMVDGKGRGVSYRDTPFFIASISSESFNNSGGDAGNVHIMVQGALKLMNNAGISSNTYAQGDAGTIIISAHSIAISAGTATVDTQENVAGIFSSSVGGVGNAGAITISAENITIDGQGNLAAISSSSYEGSQGNAGTIEITISGLLDIRDKGEIVSATQSGGGDAGSISIFAQDIIIDGQGYSTGISSGAYEGAQGNAGTVKIVLSGLLNIRGGGEISSDTQSRGDAGSIVISAENIVIDGQGYSSGISSSAYEESLGNGGKIEITVSGLLELMDNALIASGTLSRGDAGSITISAGEININGHGYSSGIVSNALEGSQGNAGAIKITASGPIEIINGGEISSGTWSKGDAGTIIVSAGDIIIDGHGFYAGIVSNALENSQGNAGTIKITASGTIEIINRGEISSGTLFQGDGGSIIISARDINIDGQGNTTGIISAALENSQGNAGTIDVTVSGLLGMINGGAILSSTYSTGDAGNIFVTAENIKMDGRENTAGIAGTAEGLDGEAGTIKLRVSQLLEMLNNSVITSGTRSRGSAGTIEIDAGRIVINSSQIRSKANETAAGNVGNISMEADSVILMNGAEISIAANQTLGEDQLDHLSHDPKSITLNTRELKLDGNSKITSESTGNVPASDIAIQAEGVAITNSSPITTSAENADGGDITIQGRNIFLHHGLITTSVKDLKGDGGDITVQGMTEDEPALYLIMQHGFIQANSAAENARGGNINLEINGIIVDQTYKPLSIEDPQRRDFEKDPLVNVIQAAAPGGTKGEVNISDAPELDISGVIVNMNADLSRPVSLATDPCLMLGSDSASSLIQGTKGGFLEWPENPSTIFFDSERLKVICKNKFTNAF